MNKILGIIITFLMLVPLFAFNGTAQAQTNQPHKCSGSDVGAYSLELARLREKIFDHWLIPGAARKVDSNIGGGILYQKCWLVNDPSTHWWKIKGLSGMFRAHKESHLFHEFTCGNFLRMEFHYVIWDRTGNKYERRVFVNCDPGTLGNSHFIPNPFQRNFGHGKVFPTQKMPHPRWYLHITAHNTEYNDQEWIRTGAINDHTHPAPKSVNLTMRGIL